DPLTGLANHRQRINALEAEIRRSRRTAQPLAVVLLDLDGLKQINDRHGHLSGSLAIRRVAEALLGSCRATDSAARFGGDEFALVLPETSEGAAPHGASSSRRNLKKKSSQKTPSCTTTTRNRTRPAPSRP